MSLFLTISILTVSTVSRFKILPLYKPIVVTMTLKRWRLDLTPSWQTCNYRCEWDRTYNFHQLLVMNLFLQLPGHPSRHLRVQSQQWKHQKNEWNLFKFNERIIIYLRKSILRALPHLVSNNYWCSHNFLSMLMFMKKTDKSMKLLDICQFGAKR